MSPQNDDRESIWTVTQGAKKWYFLAFFALFLTGMGLVASYEVIEEGSGKSTLNLLTAVLDHAGSIAIGSAVVAMMLADVLVVSLSFIWSRIMVLAERYLRHLREKRLAEGRAEGLVEGRAEGLVEGRAEGLVEGRAETRAKLQAALEEARQNGEDARVIAAYEKMLKAIDD